MIYCTTFFVLLYLFVYATQRKWVILEGNMVGYCIGQLFFYIVVAKFQVFIFQNILKPTFYYILKLLFLFYKKKFYWAMKCLGILNIKFVFFGKTNTGTCANLRLLCFCNKKKKHFVPDFVCGASSSFHTLFYKHSYYHLTIL